MKFFAVLLIINSHADIMYPKLSALATGGAIGDCLFLFVSGFTLFLAAPRRFDNYYKRRLRRIVPSVISALIFIKLVNPEHTFTTLELAGGEFITALFAYYFILYFVRRYALNHIPLILVSVIALSILTYIFFFPYKYEVGAKGMYGISTPFRWLPYFAFMLMGAYLGWKKKMGHDTYNKSVTFSFSLMIFSCILFYGIQVAAKISSVAAPWQIISIFPLLGIIYGFYRWCEAPLFTRLIGNRVIRSTILFVAGLCLESYLIQYSLITDKLNSIWPLNILLVILLILGCSYAVRCVSRIILQTFSTEDYNWKEVFKPY